MSKWLPIESAPKDGTWVLLRGGFADDEMRGNRAHIVSAQYTTTLNGQKCEGQWQFAWFDGGYYGWYKDPTQWMPLELLEGDE